MPKSLLQYRFLLLLFLCFLLIWGAYRFQNFRTDLARKGQVELSRLGSEDAEARLLQIAAERLERAKELYLRLNLPWPAEFVQPLPAQLKSEAEVTEYDEHELAMSQLIATAINHSHDSQTQAEASEKKHESTSSLSASDGRKAIADFMRFEKSTQAQREQFEGLLRDHFRIEKLIAPDQNPAQ